MSLPARQKEKRKEVKKGKQAHKKLFYEASRNSSQDLATEIDAFNMGMNSDIQEM